MRDWCYDGERERESTKKNKSVDMKKLWKQLHLPKFLWYPSYNGHCQRFVALTLVLERAKEEKNQVSRLEPTLKIVPPS